MKLPKHVWHFGGKVAGPNVVIMAGVHGDEKLGVLVLEELRNVLDATELCGDVYLILGNPVAYAHGVRFIDEDLNRLFGEKAWTNSLEAKRCEELKPVLLKADFLLDLHSTIKPARPFVYCEPDEQHLNFASLFCLQHVVSPTAEFRPNDLISSADNFVDNNGAIGITYESGWQMDFGRFDEVLENVKKFLQKLGVFNFSFDLELNKNFQHFYIDDQIIVESDDFVFNKNLSNFDFLASTSLIAYQNSLPVRLKSDAYVIFPKSNFVLGKPACYLAFKK